MVKDQASNMPSFCHFCSVLIFLSSLSSVSFLYWSHYSNSSWFSQDDATSMQEQQQNEAIHLLSFPKAWNHLSFSSNPPPKFLKIAVFVKKWPQKNQAGGLERHALTLHLVLAERGHELHIFTTSSLNSSFPKYSLTNLHFHLSKPTAAGRLDQAVVWKQFQNQNSTIPFDVIHTESVGLYYTRARNLTNLAVSWHGIAYEVIHSDIIQELVRSPDESRSYALTERIVRIVEEVKFFPSYAHHVATSDYAGDVLKRIYMIPDERVHVILNGVDNRIFKPELKLRKDFRKKFGIPESSTSLVLGMAGRLVKDKGHPLMFEALKQIFEENETFRKSVYVVVAGDGPWGDRYKNLGSNLLVLGPLEQSQLAMFYNGIDIFVNPTLRAQGLDHTLLEATVCGKPVMATKFASITRSVVVSPEMGYTFSPTVASLKEALYMVWRDHRNDRGAMEQKGEVARQRGLKLFTAVKMAAAYEKLFLCIASQSQLDKKNVRDDYCRYLPSDNIAILDK
ncbi:Udp-glycosyltransferase superfamily protein [Thalictrum thalictroides]|uniref:Udp-glycosyltransferase superfamily protein n=1 Tax=Thalictrum thalictroides TaxID=46969 RepID=A0A7J6VF45_THATH|nr:Udp-glycosyltransferase superfamily protein [Thalictrum thalictroides]